MEIVHEKSPKTTSIYGRDSTCIAIEMIVYVFSIRKLAFYHASPSNLVKRKKTKIITTSANFTCDVLLFESPGNSKYFKKKQQNGSVHRMKWQESTTTLNCFPVSKEAKNFNTKYKESKTYIEISRNFLSRISFECILLNFTAVTKSM